MQELFQHQDGVRVTLGYVSPLTMVALDVSFSKSVHQRALTKTPHVVRVQLQVRRSQAHHLDSEWDEPLLEIIGSLQNFDVQDMTFQRRDVLLDPTAELLRTFEHWGSGQDCGHRAEPLILFIVGMSHLHEL